MVDTSYGMTDSPMSRLEEQMDWYIHEISKAEIEILMYMPNASKLDLAYTPLDQHEFEDQIALRKYFILMTKQLREWIEYKNSLVGRLGAVRERYTRLVDAEEIAFFVEEARKNGHLSMTTQTTRIEIPDIIDEDDFSWIC